MARRPSLSTEVVGDIREKITTNELQLGQQIPTEAALCEQYNVSRTVIREAIARLRSEGLLEARQGVGVFVSDSIIPSRFEIDWDQVKYLSESVSLLEMRIAIEVEAASLCAARRSDEDVAKLHWLRHKVAQQFAEPQASYFEFDFEFHLTVAKGTKNPYFFRFLAFLKPIVIPTINPRADIDPKFKEAYFAAVNDEHAAIAHAIERSDPEKSRRTMRAHIENSRTRLSDLATTYGVEALGVFDPKQPDLMRDLAKLLAAGKSA